ncbi:MAG: hypothetical protein ACRCUT_11745 [Spirochaetota bacterium]
MKRTDLEKQRGHKINNRINNSGGGMPFQKNDPAVDKKEQRKRDQALGLVPFAVKLNEDLVAQINDTAVERKITVSELVAELLKKGLEK